MASSEMKLEIPQDIVLSVVKAQVIAALGKSEQLVSGVVASALSAKRNSYDRTTLFEEQVTAMIHEVATECFKEWLAESKEKIRAELRRQLTAQKGKAITDLVDTFTSQLATIYPSVSLKITND